MHKWTYFLDVSTNRTGVILFRDDEKEIIVTDLVFSKIKRDSKKTKIENQLYKFKEIKKILDNFTQEYPPMKDIYMEGIFIKNKFLNSSEVSVKFHGFLIMYFIEYDLHYFPPKQIKKIVTGNGNSKKEDVQKILEKKYNITFNNNDESDAFGIFHYFLEINNKNIKKTKINKK